jgi:hypothetical protein
MRKDILLVVVVLLLLVTLFAVLPKKAQAAPYECDGILYTDVTVTAFFTPREQEYSGPKVTVNTDRGRRAYKKDFLEGGLYTEWHGLSEQDGALGYWDEDGDGKNEIHHTSYPLDAVGERLVLYQPAYPDIAGTAGATEFLTTGTQFRVLTLPGKPLYRVSDTISKPMSDYHVNVYVGEGRMAEKRSRTMTQLDGIGVICVLD